MAGNGGIIGPPNTVTNGCAACGTASGMWRTNTVYNFATSDYLVVGGGGGSGGNYYHIQGGGGGGAGGYRASGYGPSPLRGTAISQRWGTYGVTVGAGGTKGGQASAGSSPGPGTTAGAGGASVYNPAGVEGTTKISASGGGGGAQPSTQGAPGHNAQPGGSGGGGGGSGGCAGTGNAGGYCKSEGNAGGAGGTGCMTGSGAGGGALGAGGTSPGAGVKTPLGGGAGAPNAITGTALTYAAGGGFASRNPAGALIRRIDAQDNTGNGAYSQGAGPSPANPSGSANYDGLVGGSGVVILRSSSYMSTDSNCAPVNSPDGGTGTFIAEFKASSNVTFTSLGSNELDYLVVAGGGGGGGICGPVASGGGGGGAGGYRSSFPGGTKLFLNPGTNQVVIGAGGAGGMATVCSSVGSIGKSGTDSWISTRDSAPFCALSTSKPSRFRL